jgi:glycosyltransferase involved in cell wall biosynthesis
MVDKYGLDPARVRVLPYGTRMERREAAVGASTPTGRPVRLLTVGRMAVEKNVALLVDTFASLLGPGGLDVELEIVGDGPTRDEVASQIRTLGLERKVHLAGRLDGTDLVDAYDRADLFVMTSLVDSFGIVLIEAMARGLPVIAPDIPGVRDVVRDGYCGLLVDHSVASVGDAVRRVLTEPGLREHLVEGALAHSAGFRWPEIARQHLSLYAQVVEGAAGGAS